MKLGILDTVPSFFWHVDQGITDAEKFENLLSPAMPETTFDKYYVAEGEWPDQFSDHDAYLITGSPCSANDQLTWIDKLEEFIRECAKNKTKLVGVCFGHQIIAKALGGIVEKRSNGWLLGLQTFDIISHQPWMSPQQSKSTINHINQDQVTSLPDSANLIGSSTLCPNSAFMVGESIFSLQGHPEQLKQSMENFIDELIKEGADERIMEIGRSSLIEEVPDADLWRNWISSFLLSP